MKFSVIRNGSTVCIGHCRGFECNSETQAFNAVQMIIAQNANLTYTKSFYELRRGDTVKLWMPDGVHSMKVTRNGGCLPSGVESDKLEDYE